MQSKIRILVKKQPQRISCYSVIHGNVCVVCMQCVSECVSE
jgi:ferredoxin